MKTRFLINSGIHEVLLMMEILGLVESEKDNDLSCKWHPLGFVLTLLLEQSGLFLHPSVGSY